MGFIAEYTLSNPILQETRRRVPEVEFEVEDEQPVPGDRSRLIFWVRGSEDSLERVFRELPNDPSLTDFEILSDVPERCLLRVSLSSEGERGLTYIDAIEFGITLLSIELYSEGVEYRAQFPNREALANYRKRCQDRGLSFTLRRLYRGEDDEVAAYGVTPRQREVLLRALERGYYEVPRGTSTAELADEFGISSQALSALLRRGQEALLRSTIADETDT
ncbi:helix-turn-helix domain-containing protein [Halorussus caseinilyticus]|uniref:Helix-turn-helix domain-containing protein n=1 Tax=Halorussus caseinilyticus TaxID=3034025 RepID=A0ABD5WL20_9EURY|nr:helix-turn-helix domain-containing protein [Halorussus sp. DT72]